MNSESHHPEGPEEESFLTDVNPKESESYMTAYNLALGLEARAKYAEALTFARRSEDGWRRQLGSEHANTRGAERVRRRIEAQVPRPVRR